MDGKTPRKPGKRLSDTEIRDILDNIDNEFSDDGLDSDSGSEFELSEDTSGSDGSSSEQDESKYTHKCMRFELSKQVLL